MKKQGTISDLLGVTQLTMAMLLRVHTSQWSMYESEKRNLPETATERLAEILDQMQTKGGHSKKVSAHAKQQEEAKELLEALLKENNDLLEITIRKTAAMQKKHDDHIKALQLADFLASDVEHQEAWTFQVAKLIESKATKGLEKNGLPQLVKLQIKEKLLQLEQELLTKALDGLKL